jgi:nuclear pore complex protein Nup98-Nup96
MTPYGSPLVPPQLQLATTEIAPAKRSLLGTMQSPAAGNAATAFPVRSLTPRSPWLTSRGGLSREAKPRGSAALPSPGGAAQSIGTPVSAARPGSAVSVATPSSGGWLFKPRENPRALFIRPEGASASPAPSIALAVSPTHADRSPERRQVHFSDDGEQAPANTSSIRSEVLPKLTAEGYSMSPTLEQMERMLERNGQDALAAIDNFSVSNETFGRVKWLEPVDVRGLNLNKIVLFEQACLCLYPEDQGITPPEEGQGLKKRAEVTLYGILPKRSGDAAKAKYEEKIKKQTEKAGAELIEYNADTGIWKFSLQL